MSPLPESPRVHRPSRSADASRRAQQEHVRSLSPAERVVMAFRAGATNAALMRGRRRVA